MTTTLTDAPLLRIRIAQTDLSDLAQDSDVMVDVERAVMTFLGLAR